MSRQYLQDVLSGAKRIIRVDAVRFTHRILQLVFFTPPCFCAR